MFPNFAGVNEIVFYKHLGNGVGGVRSSLGRCMEDFFAVRAAGDARMIAHVRSGVVRPSRPAMLKQIEAEKEFRAMNGSKGAQRQNDDNALSS